MSEERMVRIEAVLTAMQADMASVKAEVASIKSGMATNEDRAGVAKSADVRVLARRMQQLLATKDDVRVLTAIFQRLDNTVIRQIIEMSEIRAEHSRMDRLLSSS